MAKNRIEIGMKPSHPGEVIREEVLEVLNLSVSKAAEVLGVRRATLSDLLNEKAALSPEMALRIKKSLRPPHGYHAADAGLAGCKRDARAGRGNQDRAL